MAQLAPFAWAMLVAAAIIVGLSKTAIPGAAALAVAMFAAVLPARSSTAALLLLLIIGDVLALALYRRHADRAALLRLAPSVIGGVAIGAVFLALADDGVVRRVIGAILLMLVVVTLWLRRTSKRAAEPGGARGALVGYGTLGGFTTMVANAGGPVMSLYFLAARFDVRSFLGTAAWFFAIVNLTKLPITIGLGLLTWDVVAMDLLLAPAVIVGGAFGWLIARRITQAAFDRIVLFLTAATAAFLLLSPA